MKKILLCTTFREFNDNENAQMQYAFLDSLKRQTYKNFELIITVFKEKNVEKALSESNLPFKIYKDENPEYRFSLSEVVLNCLDSSQEDDIIVWTTSDIIFSENFFETIINQTTEKTIGISYPLTIYNDFNHYKKNNGEIFYLGIDTIIFSADVFLNNQQAKDDLVKYKFINWGMFEFFLIGLGILYFKKLLIVAPNSIKKIENNRIANNETRDYLESSNENNRNIFKSFTKKYDLDNNFYAWILKYKSVKYKPFIKNRLYLYIIKSKIIKLVPSKIKKIIKRKF